MIKVISVVFVLLPLLVFVALPPLRAAASGATVTVSTTPGATIQTQLSTNIVTWGSDFTQIPNAQSNLNALNAPLVRLHVGDDGGPAMPEINQGSWDMTTIDTMVNDVFASGQQPLMNIKFAPDFMWTCYPNSVGVNGNQGTGHVSDLTFQTFARYMARLASYYNKGSLTKEDGTVLVNPAGTSHKITYWELWNEPDLNIETPCAPLSGYGITYKQYTTMWNAVTSAMLAVDPTLKFIGPVTAGSQFGSSSTTGNQYIDYLMANSTVKPYAISFHDYGYWDNTVPDKYLFDGDGTPGGGGITDMVSGVQAIHKYYPSYPIWITEANVNADWGTDTNLRNTDALSAAWWGTVIQSLAPLGVSMIHQFDFTGAPQFGLIDGEGIENSSGGWNDPTGNLELPYFVMQQIDAAFPPGSVIVQSTSTQSGILSLAARKPDGSYSVLVIDRKLVSSTDVSNCTQSTGGGVAANVTVDVSALSPSSITITQIDKSNINCSSTFGSAPATRVLPLTNPVPVSFPGYGIAILHIA